MIPSIPTTGAGRTRHARRWTPEDDRTLRELWARGASPAMIAPKIDRTPVAVYGRAHGAGLTSRAPQGFETITASAKRTGLALGTLWGILRAAGVKVQNAPVAPWLKRRHMKIVRRVKVTRAVTAHLQLESVTQAAQRVGVPICYLLRRLHLNGVRARKPKAKLLITEEQLQAALAIPPGNTLYGRKRA